MVGENFKWWWQNPNIGHPHGSLVGKYKPVGKKISFLAGKKNPWTLLRQIWKYILKIDSESIFLIKYYIITILKRKFRAFW
jgi:hypothetical protein